MLPCVLTWVRDGFRDSNILLGERFRVEREAFDYLVEVKNKVHTFKVRNKREREINERLNEITNTEEEDGWKINLYLVK